jgi:hypothetical protein
VPTRDKPFIKDHSQVDSHSNITNSLGFLEEGRRGKEKNKGRKQV